MTFRVGIASFMQESNTFAPKLMELPDFEVLEGLDIIDFFDNTNSEIAGFLDGCREMGWQQVPLISANAISGGPLSKDTFERLCFRVVESIKNSSIDGLLLALHGAMSSEHLVSADVEIVQRLRQALGRSIPIAVTHDLHANLAARFFKYVDTLTGYRTYPHVDQRATGRRACSMLRRIISGTKSRHLHLPIPMLLSPQASSTFEEPMAAVFGELDQLFRESEGNYATLFLVQPWLDLKGVSSCLAVTQVDSEMAINGRMHEVAKRLWSIRRQLEVDWLGPEQLIGAIHASASRPILISEAADAPTAGAAGDHTGLLQCLLPQADKLNSCIYLVDPPFAQLAHSLGVGAEIESKIGASIDARYSKAVFIHGRIEHLSNGEFLAKGPAFNGRRFSMGKTAVVGIKQLRIIVASKPVMMIDPELYRSQGIDPAHQDAVGIKSPLLFRPAYEPISRAVAHLDLPGPCRGRLGKVPFQNIGRPIFPLDDFEWQPPEPTCVHPTI